MPDQTSTLQDPFATTSYASRFKVFRKRLRDINASLAMCIKWSGEKPCQFGALRGPISDHARVNTESNELDAEKKKKRA